MSWTGEQTFDLRPSRDFPGLTELVQEQKPGVGAPVFGFVHVTRQRLAMVGHLCHVCGRPTSRRDRWLFPVETGGFVTHTDGEIRYGGNVPPVHLACARKAQRLCPRLSNSDARPVAFPDDAGRLVQRTDVVPGMEALARTLPTGVEVVFSCYRLFGKDFTKRVQRLRLALQPPKA